MTLTSSDYQLINLCLGIGKDKFLKSALIAANANQPRIHDQFVKQANEATELMTRIIDEGHV